VPRNSGFASGGGRQNAGRLKRLAKEAANKKYKKPQKAATRLKTSRDPAKEVLGRRVPSRSSHGRRPRSSQRAQDAQAKGRSREKAREQGPRLRLQTRDIMKALDNGCSDAELQAMLSQARKDLKLAEDSDEQFRTWPPETDFEEGDVSENLARVERTAIERLATLASNGTSNAIPKLVRAVENNTLPVGLLELQALEGGIALGDSLSTSTDDSESDDFVTTALPTGRPARLTPGRTRSQIVHVYPDPVRSGRHDESSVGNSESSEDVNSSEQARAERRKLLRIEYTTESKLNADPDFQRRLRRWRAGLPNFERPAPPQSAHAHDAPDAVDGYDYLYSHDDAAEPLSDAEPATLGDSFR
jgi:hypothetical protein